MKAQLNSYLSNTPNSSLNIFSSLQIAQLERMAGLELQKFSINYNSLSDEQKKFFLTELDKALTNINIMRGIVADINKEVQLEAARAENLEAQDIVKSKKEEEEKQERKSMESLGVAIQMASLKTSASVNQAAVPGLAAIAAVDALNTQFTKVTKALDAQLVKVTEMLLSKIKIVKDKHSTVGDTGYMDENGNISQTGVLTHVLRFQNNVNFLAKEFGIRGREVHKLMVVDGRVIVDIKGKEDIYISFSALEDLFRTTMRENATTINPMTQGNVQAINLAKRKAAAVKEFFEEKARHLDAGVAQHVEWRVMILQERKITINMDRIEEQLSDIASTAPQSFVEQLTRQRAAFELLIREQEELRAAREKATQVQMLTIHEQIKKGVSLNKTSYNLKPKFTETIAKNPGISPEEIDLPRRGDGEVFMHRPSKGPAQA